MASKKRVDRFVFLAQLQTIKVDQATRSYRAAERNLAQAESKLTGLQEYFENGPAVVDEQRSPMALHEASVFASRLSTAIDTQQTLCQQLQVQLAQARRAVTSAQHRRMGFEKASVVAKNTREKIAERLEARRSEDNIMARYGGLRNASYT